MWKVCFLSLALIGVSAATPVTIFGTGVSVDSNGVDRNYTLTSSDLCLKSTKAYVANNIWGPQLAGTKWINPIGNGQDGFGDYLYTYTTRFNLTGFTAASTVLSGSLLADDQVTIFLNGVAVSAAGIGTYTRATDFTIGSQYGSLFQSGWNTLAFQVRNSGSGPTGLDVNLAGTAMQATPEPNTVGLLAFSGALMIGAGLARRKKQSVKR